MTPRLKETLILPLTASLLAVALTWPIAARFGSAGRVDSGDGRFSVWNVAWVAHALTTNPWQVYNANIFYPHTNTLAFSEANLVAGLIAVPVWLLTKNPHAASNWTILVSFVLSFVTMYLLVRRLTGSIAGAAMAAISFAYCAFVFSHIPHVQLLMTFGLPLILLALHAFVEAPTLARAVWLGATMALQALASGYYGIFGGLLAGFGVLWFGVAARRWRDWRYWGLALLAALVALLIVAPFFMPYLEVRAEGFARSIDDARPYSVRWRSYFVSPTLVNRWLLNLIASTGEWREVLFPGYLAIGFSIVAVIWSVGRRGREGRVPVRRSVIGFYLASAFLAVWISFGPDAGLYRWLYHAVPALSMTRAPARFGLILTLALSVVGGAGFAAVERALSGRRRTWVVLAVLAFAVTRSTVGGLVLAEAPPLREAYRRLISLPRGPVAEFPFFRAAGDRFRHTDYMLMSTYHWKPLINGYSDHIPPAAYEDMVELEKFPELGAWRVLRDHLARYVLMHWHIYSGLLTPEELEALRHDIAQQQTYLRPIVEAPDLSLYEIVRWPSGADD